MAITKKQLKLYCRTQGGVDKTITLPDPKDEVDKTDIQGKKNAFSDIGLAINSFQLVTTQTSDKFNV